MGETYHEYRRQLMLQMQLGLTKTYNLFHPENDRTRYTIHRDARRELLKRLLLLNHKRYAEEQAAAKTNRPAVGKKKSAAQKSGRGKQAGPSLFSGDDPDENS